MLAVHVFHLFVCFVVDVVCTTSAMAVFLLNEETGWRGRYDWGVNHIVAVFGGVWNISAIRLFRQHS